MFRKLINLLKKQSIHYQEIKHKTTYTAVDLALTTGIDLKEVIKTLLIKADGQFVLVALPGHRNLDLAALKKFLNNYYKSKAKTDNKKFSTIKAVKVCTETQIKRNLTNSQSVNLMPIGHFYNKDLFVDNLLLRNKKIVFPAGSFERAVRITTSNYLKFSQPVHGSFSVSRK